MQRTRIRSYIVELKAIKSITKIEWAQVIHYMRATRIPYALLLNFGRPQLQYDTFDLAKLPSGSVIDTAYPPPQGAAKRLALPNNFAKTISPMVEATRAVRFFLDEYLPEHVNLDNVDAIHDQDVDERVLSNSLVANIEKTIQALGGDDFCFMGREKRLVYSGEEFFIDLLFYHRDSRQWWRSS